MTRFILDSWAWLEYFRGSKTGLMVKHHLEKGGTLTHSVTISEVISKLRRQGEDTRDARQAFAALPRIVDTDRATAAEVGELHAKVRIEVPNFSLADAFVLEAARRLELKVLTGDPDFRGIKEAEFLE
jgi:PIN domain nuclease of toxin-antitoxin system